MRFWELVYHVCLSSFASITWALSMAGIRKDARLRLKHRNWAALRFHPPACLSKPVRRLRVLGKAHGYIFGWRWEASITWALSLACISNGARLRLKHLNWTAVLSFQGCSEAAMYWKRRMFRCKVPLPQLLVQTYLIARIMINRTCGMKEVWLLETMDAMRLRISFGSLVSGAGTCIRHGLPVPGLCALRGDYELPLGLGLW